MVHSRWYRLVGLSLASALSLAVKAETPVGAEGSRLSLNRWTYLEIDTQRSGRAFGLAMADLTGDGWGDIASGRYFYRNPGRDMAGRWRRSAFPLDVDALLTLDVDHDDRGDLIAMDASGQVYWLEADDATGARWKARPVGDVGKADHNISSQGYALGQLIKGGKPEIIINVGSIYYFEIPSEPGEVAWPRTAITRNADPEGVAVGDFDRDGNLDVCGATDTMQVAWWKNPGKESDAWQTHVVGVMPDKYADRFYAVDLNDDSRLDIAVSAANGTKNGVYWWEHRIEDGAKSSWILRTVVVQDTTNSMDVADMDGDGDMDIVAGEHRGTEKVAIWENNGRGRFTENIVSTGKESHLGTRVADLDEDGDLDIVSIAWDEPEYLHLWRNDAIGSSPDSGAGQ